MVISYPHLLIPLSHHFPNQRVATGLAAQILNMGSVSDGAHGGCSGGGGGGGTWGTRGQGMAGDGATTPCTYPLVICYIAMV
jgi:hypothetical protein